MGHEFKPAVKFWKLYFSNRFENTALLSKFCILLSILIHSLLLLPNHYFIYETSWVERVPEGIRIQPSIFLILNYINNPYIIRFFVLAEILAVMNAMRHLRSVFAMLPVIFFTMNNYQRAWAIQDGGNNLTHIFIFYLLLLIPVGKEISSDAGERGVLLNQVRAAFTNSSVLLIRTQLIFMYFAAAISKIQGEMWQKGTALFYVYQSDYFGTQWARDLMMRHPEVSTLGSYMGIMFQLAFCFLVFSKTFRYPLLIAGIVFHLVIAVSMKLYIFSLTMVLVYSAFLEDKDAKAVLRFLDPETLYAWGLKGQIGLRNKFRTAMSKVRGE